MVSTSKLFSIILNNSSFESPFGPLKVLFLLKIGSPFGPLFEYFGSPSKMGTVPPPLPHLPQDAEWRVGLGDGEGEQRHCDELLADVMTSSLLSTVSESEEGCTGEVGDRPWWFGQLDLADLASVDPGRGRAAEASRGNC